MVCPGRANLRKITETERLEGLKMGRIFIPVSARICQFHPSNVEFWEQVWPMASIDSYNAKFVEDMVDLARSSSAKSSEAVVDIPTNSGLTIHEFGELQSLVPPLWTTTSSVQDAKNALLMFLMRLRKAQTYEHIANVFGISQFKVISYIRKARDALEVEFVPKFLGFANLGRELLLQNSTDSARILHGNNNVDTLITIWDGTYIYCEKSANQEFQKLTFNPQKNRNFLRPMVCVTANGYIVDIFGLFPATWNDAKCMNHIIDRIPEVNMSYTV